MSEPLNKDLIISHNYDPSNQIEMSETRYHLLCYLLTGKHTRKITRIGNQEYTGNILSGDICIKPASYSGFWSWEEPDDSLLFYISPHFLYQIAEQNDCLNSNKVELLPVLNHNDGTLHHLVTLFKQEINCNYSGGKMYRESLSNLLGLHLLRHYCSFPIESPEYTGGLGNYKLKQIIGYINDRLADDISLYELANEVKLSPSYFSTLFRQSTGKSPYGFVVEQRITKAKELLINTKMTISDIAVTVGFYDQSHLSRHMKKLLGVSPRQLRLQG